MELLIDTWNVLHQTGILPPESAGIGTDGLTRMIKRSRWSRDRITLICDGTPFGDTTGGARFQLVFTGPRHSADDEIIRRVTNSSSARSILVITSDREIIRSIKAAKAQHLGSAAFLQALVDDYRVPATRKVHRPSGLSPSSAKEWKDHFGINDQIIEDLNDSAMQHAAKPDRMKQPKKVPSRKTSKPRVVKLDEPLLPQSLLEEARKLLDSKDD